MEPVRKSPVDEQDPMGYIGEEYRDAPKEKCDLFVNPQTGKLMMRTGEDSLLDLEGMDTPVPFEFDSDLMKLDDQSLTPYVDPERGDLLADRAFYHHSPERYDYSPAPDWNDDTTSLPDAWVRAHPFGHPYSKDAHGQYFDRKTDFHDKLLTSVPVSYYHNYTPEGEPSGDPMAIGKTIARKYTHDGRWDKIRFNDGMPKEIKARVAEALARGTLRASPTVVPDFHEVDRNGHIKNWLTGSIAVLDAYGARQPASPKAIGLPAMKALFKSASIQFPKELEMQKGKFSKARTLLKALLKALGEEDEMKADGPQHEEPDGDEEMLKALFEDSNPEESAKTEGALGGAYWTNKPKYLGITESGRFGAASRENVQKDVSGLPKLRDEDVPDESDEGNPLQDPEIRLDWARQQKALHTMKSQVVKLQEKADNGDFDSWFTAQMIEGKVVPAERQELYVGFRQALSDDRAMRPQMKSSSGAPISRVRVYQRAIEARQGKFGDQKLTGAEMKALGYQVGGFDQNALEKEWSDKRRNELMGASPLGNTILKEERGGKHA